MDVGRGGPAAWPNPIPRRDPAGPAVTGPPVMIPPDMGVPRPTVRLLAVLLLGPLAAPAPAPAATAVGASLDRAADAPGGGAGPCPGIPEACTVALLRDGAGRDAAVPADGVLVAVAVRAAPGAGGVVVPRVLRPAGGDTVVPVADGPPVTLTGGVQRVPVRLPVRAGDVLALRADALPGVFAAPAGAGTHAVFAEPPAWPVGADPREPDPGAPLPGDLLLAAELEADGDGDGFGDETQDACPTDPACAVALGLRSSGPLFGVTGRPVEHAYAVHNTGPVPAQQVRLDLGLPATGAVRDVRAPGPCVAIASASLRCALGTLAPGAEAVVVLVLDAEAGAVVRSAATAAGEGDPPVVSGLGTTFTAASVAPPPRPFAVVACANLVRGTGDDEVVGGTSFGDRLLGGAGRDLLRGLSGDDCLEGGAGGDVLDGGPGADRLAGGDGHDRLLGEAGDDRLRGGLRDDVLLGGAGADVLEGGPGRDRFAGGPGDDRVEARDGVAEQVDCGRGADTARLDRRDRARGCERVIRR